VCAAILLFWLPAAAHAGRCSASGPLQNLEVRHVHDGDTVLLSSGEKLRLIGINTPEAGRRDKPAEPLADRATDELRAALADAGYQVAVQVGKGKYDRHGRLLGHLFTRDGRNLTARLLRKGLGFHIAIPPNLELLDCYRQAEQLARQKKRGIWATPYHQARDSLSITARDGGFVHVSGRVERVGNNRRAYYLDLPGAVSVRIDRLDSHRFDTPLENLVGTTITARGWSYRYKDRLYIRIRHPAALHTTP